MSNKYHTWLLKPLDDEQPVWNPWYDKAFGFLVSARTEEEARAIANDNGGDETGPVSNVIYRHGGDPWLDPELTSCVKVVGGTGKPEVLLRNFASA